MKCVVALGWASKPIHAWQMEQFYRALVLPKYPSTPIPGTIVFCGSCFAHLHGQVHQLIVNRVIHDDNAASRRR
jgi:hypothetical protein